MPFYPEIGSFSDVFTRVFQGWRMFSITKFEFQSVITGYHVYKKKPIPGTICSLRVEREDPSSLAIVNNIEI